MNPIDFLPDFNWSEHARAEIAVSGQDLIDQSEVKFAVGEVAIAGLVYTSYTSPPWFWFALAEDVRMSDLIDFRRLQAMIPPGALTAIRQDRPLLRRFASFYGFSDSGREQQHNGLTYLIYRRD